MHDREPLTDDRTNLKRSESGFGAQDISERQLCEKAYSILAAIVEQSEDAIISASLGGVIESWNVGAQQIF